MHCSFLFPSYFLHTSCMHTASGLFPGSWNYWHEPLCPGNIIYVCSLISTSISSFGMFFSYTPSLHLEYRILLDWLNKNTNVSNSWHHVLPPSFTTSSLTLYAYASLRLAAFQAAGEAPCTLIYTWYSSTSIPLVHGRRRVHTNSRGSGSIKTVFISV